MASGPQRDIEVQAALGRSAKSDSWYHTRIEKSFLVNEEFTNASTGDTSAIAFENPAGSGESAVFAKPFAQAPPLSFIRIYDAFDGDITGGTSLAIENNLLDSGGEGGTDPGVVTATENPTFTATNTKYSMLVGGSTGAQQGTPGNLQPFIMEPGRKIVFEVEKVNSGDNNVVINAEWHEQSIVFSDQAAPYDDAELL